MTNEKSCRECGSPLGRRSKACPLCGASVQRSAAIPEERVAGETERGIVDVELASKRAARFTRSAWGTDADPPELSSLW